MPTDENQLDKQSSER